MRSRLCSLLSVILFACAGSAHATIQDGLESMFLTTGQEPAIYESQRRLGVTLGTLRLRAPMSRVNVMNISPPGYRAGCGGIDLYGGSFTFINGEQFRQILRQIGANALGYAFKLALSTMCEKCDAILTGLQQKIDDLNRMSMDSCRWAQGLVNSAADHLPFQVNEKHMEGDRISGVFEDSFAGVLELFENPGEEYSGGHASGADPTDPNTGNYTVNALTIGDVGNKFTFVAGGLTNNELLMNIAGTYILRAKQPGEAGEGNVHPELSARLSYDELRDGKIGADGAGDAIPLMTCGGEPLCVNPTDLSEWDFPGVRSWVADRLDAAAMHMAVPGTSATPHSADLQQFLANLPFTVVRHMQYLQNDEDSLRIYVAQVRGYIVQVYTSTIALTMSRAIRAAYDRTDTPNMPETVRASLDVFEEAAKKELDATQIEYAETWLETEELMAFLTRNEGLPLYRVRAKQ